MSYSLFLDDMREVPSDRDDWAVARTAAEARDIILTRGLPSYMWLDNDLGHIDFNEEGAGFVNWLIDHVVTNDLRFPPDFDYVVKSSNPPARENIEGKMHFLLGLYKDEE